MNQRLRELYAMKAAIEKEIDREQAMMLRLAKLRDLTHEVLVRQPMIKVAMEAVAAEFELAMSDLTTAYRGPNVVSAARHVAAAVLRRQGLAYVEIGRVLDRDHTTIIHSCQRVDADPELSAITVRVVTRIAHMSLQEVS